jgi:hypothetical protein
MSEPGNTDRPVVGDADRTDDVHRTDGADRTDDADRTTVVDRDRVDDGRVTTGPARIDRDRIDRDRVDRDPADREEVVEAAPTRDDVLAREKARYGGMKFGSAFFGWLAATGTAAILGAIVAAIRFGVTGTTGSTATNASWLDVLLAVVVLFVAYLAGGYVAGRMARFNGARQGVAVWLWALVVAIIVGIIGAIVGTQWDILANLQSFPRLPFTGQNATVIGIVGAIVLLIVTLVGAILGGVAGMAYHRRVDRAGWESNRHLSS